jgi:ribosomal protein L17
MKATEKIYKIKKTRSGMNGSRETIFEGTLERLKNEVFGYTLECGASWNRKINRNPKTISALITAINKSYNEIEGGYTRSYVELAA